MIKIKLKISIGKSSFYKVWEEKLEGEFSEAFFNAGAHKGKIQFLTEVARLGRGKIFLPQPIQKVFITRDLYVRWVKC